jgi:hypothetical protein
LLLLGCEPDVGRIIRNVRRIKQGNQHIDIEKKTQVASSLSALTISSVTMVFEPPGREQRYSVSLARLFCPPQGLPRQVGNDVSDGTFLVLGQYLCRGQHIIVNLQRRSHRELASSIKHQHSMTVLVSGKADGVSFHELRVDNHAIAA